MTAADDATSRLLALMARLRDPEGGCPWDREQNFATIAPYTIEEAYEVADAIARADLAALKDELGDLLFQVVFHAQMAAEQGAFTYADVAEAVIAKMTRRHPHVFGTADIRTAEAQTRAWEEAKAQERATKPGHTSILADVPLALPALTRAEKLTRRASRVGFDWKTPAKVLDKLREEVSEFAQTIENSDDHAAREDEFGDILFVLANYARLYGIDPEKALRSTNDKFVRRFQFIEQQLEKEGVPLADAGLERMDLLWNEAKTALARKDG
ncbi:MAG TPA: nucleoside triphosphate pyrophosphohydrolase [Micropepsaceae bacterium]|nr:nucleoside triphosphate pyrophosphohydrolase [Micropepsaceae bacterium]